MLSQIQPRIDVAILDTLQISAHNPNFGRQGRTATAGYSCSGNFWRRFEISNAEFDFDFRLVANFFSKL